MRKFNRLSKARGFTLVELMIVVAIIGVLAALAIYGVRKYLANAKSAEAKNTLGAINRGAVAAYERENMASQLVAAGTTSAGASHALCGTAAPVPGTTPSNQKYQANPLGDYLLAAVGTNDAQNGWICLKFQLSEPQYYQYAYTKGATTITAITTPAVPASGWSAEAKGDLDGNGVFANFLMAGNILNGQPVTSTTVSELNADE